MESARRVMVSAAPVTAASLAAAFVAAVSAAVLAEVTLPVSTHCRHLVVSVVSEVLLSTRLMYTPAEVCTMSFSS